MTATDIPAAERFREAMAAFPAGVTIVTCVDDDGRWRGFTATAFCSVSMEPPLVLVCLATTAECHPAFTAAGRWVVHVIGGDQVETALRFATRGADKFADARFVADERGLPVLEGASATLSCSTYATYTAGDHTILLGQVGHAKVGEQPPTVYFRRGFHELTPDASERTP